MPFLRDLVDLVAVDFVSQQYVAPPSQNSSVFRAGDTIAKYGRSQQVHIIDISSSHLFLFDLSLGIREL